MTFSIRVARSAARQLDSGLPETVAAACVEFLFGPLAAEPYRLGRPLRAPFEGLWSARRGEYRVRYRIDQQQGEVVVVDIEHRRDAYRS